MDIKMHRQNLQRLTRGLHKWAPEMRKRFLQSFTSNSKYYVTDRIFFYFLLILQYRNIIIGKVTSFRRAGNVFERESFRPIVNDTAILFHSNFLNISK